MPKASKPQTFQEVVDRGLCQFINGDPLKPGHSFCDCPHLPEPIGCRWCQEHKDVVYVANPKPLNLPFLESLK